MLQSGHLGVHPPGALGIAFFAHAKGDCIIGRGGDGITDLLKKAGVVRIDDHTTLRTLSLRDCIYANLLEADALNGLPELLLVCCNPNQLELFTGELTKFAENLAERGRIESIEDIRERVPILLVLPNGILAEQTVQTYEEQLREAQLMRRLPGVTDEMIAALLDRVVRGVSLQAGGRRGSGEKTVYVLERKGSLVFAGGGERERDRIAFILSAHDYPFKHVRGVPGTRIEFDKAMITAILNVGGLIHMVGRDGELADLRMGDLCKDPSKAVFIERTTRAVFDVGKAAGAYPADADYDEIWAGHRATIMAHAGHVTSSVKTLRDALGAGLESVKLFSNEEWILTPLRRSAANAGLSLEEAFFISLKREVQEAMARAIRHRDSSVAENGSRTKAMKLAAQRNFSIELYDAGGDNMLLIGSMLDDAHLIKLEINVYLPDEQVTRSRLDMIRVPFPVCREVEAAAESLVGLRIERGVINEISRRVGGRAGCSHIKELACNIVYFAASHLVLKRTGIDPMTTDYVTRSPDERFTLTKGLLRDSCLAYCQTTPHGLDRNIGIKRVGDEHANPVPLGEYDASFGELLKSRAQRWGEKTYIRYRTGERETAVSWRQFADRTFQIARHLIERGMSSGDRVCILSENRVEMYMFEMALFSIGAVSVPIFAGYHPPQIDYVLGHARPRWVLVSGGHQLEKIDRSRHESVDTWLCIDFDESCEDWGAQEFAPLLQTGGAGPDLLDQRIEAVRPDDLCEIMYTSGTTGPPKGVQLSHRNLISQQAAVSHIWNVDERDAVMSYLPWHHSFGGLFERFLTLYHGCELCLDDSFGRDIDRMISNWKAFDPSLFLSVPRVHDILMTRCREDAEIAKIVFGGRLRFIFTAGASLPAHVEQAYRDRHIPVLEGWGLTETSPAVTLRTLDSSWRSGYVGFPIPGVTVRIDADQEILVKGPNVMLGYLDDEDATSRVIDKDGWFHSGDLGEFTPDGLRIFGRKDGAFKLTTGEKVHPQRIETVLVNESPYIAAAIAVGSGQNDVAALIYPDFAKLREWAVEHGVDCEHPTEDAKVLDLYASELARVNPCIEVKYQRVVRAVLADREPLLERGELTPSGKLVRNAVMATHKHKINLLFSSECSRDVIDVSQAEAKGSYAAAN